MRAGTWCTRMLWRLVAFVDLSPLPAKTNVPSASTTDHLLQQLRDMEEKLARTPRKPTGGGDGGRQAGQGRSSSGSISSPLGQRSITVSAIATALHMSHRSSAGPGSREGGTPSTSTSTGVVPRIAGLAGAAAALTDGRAGAKPQRPTSRQDSGVDGLEKATSRAVAVAGEGRTGASRHYSPPGGSHTAR